MLVLGQMEARRNERLGARDPAALPAVAAAGILGSS